MTIAPVGLDEAARRSRVASDLALRLVGSLMPIATVVMMIIFALNTSAFFTRENLLAIIGQNAALFIVAAVCALLLMAGYVDLSVGSVMALCGVSAGLAFNSWGTAAGFLVALCIGVCFGLLNGFLIGILNISAIVVTEGVKPVETRLVTRSV